MTKRKPGYRTKPITITLPDGKPFEIKVTEHEWRKIYYRNFKAKLGHLHVSHSYLAAIRHCLRGAWGPQVSEHDRKTSRYSLVQALPEGYRRAMFLAAVQAWWECRKRDVSVMRPGFTAPGPACLTRLVS